MEAVSIVWDAHMLTASIRLLIFQLVRQLRVFENLMIS